jgi:hypothetical protein
MALNASREGCCVPECRKPLEDEKAFDAWLPKRRWEPV